MPERPCPDPEVRRRPAGLHGWLPPDSADDDWQVNSAGWISGDGRDYLAAVPTTGNPAELYGIDTIDQVAAMIWPRTG